MKKLSDKVWGSPGPGEPAAAVVEKAAAGPQPAEVVAEETRRQLEGQGWCLWRCSTLGDDVIVVARDELVTAYPTGYPVYLVQELEELLGASADTVRRIYEVKKLTEAVIK